VGNTSRWVISVALFAAACGSAPVAPTPVRTITIPEYNRAEWQHWIDEDRDCQDTRQEVLIEETLIAPTLDPRGCRVISGLWRDEYTGVVYTNPGDVDVEHRVPLANAHRAGGWAWDASRKRAYANDLLHAEHLVTIGAAVNRSKGDRGPDAWRPPLREGWCGYAAAWRLVKQRWALEMTADEERAVLDMCSS
jgi:hypothetical protein